MSDSKKNFGLQKAEFESLLEKLHQGDESLIRVIYTAHFEMCRSFLMQKMNAGFDTAYDITKDTLLKFRKNLLLGKIQYGNLSALFTIDAKNNFLKWEQKRKRIPKVQMNEEVFEVADDIEQHRYDDETLAALKDALKKIGEACFDLISWHYYLGLSQKEIATKRKMRGDERYITDTSIKTKLAECRKKLKELM